MGQESGETVFDELRGIIAPIARRHGMERIYLFGSRSRGDNREDSDYDLCIAAPDGFDLFDLEHFLRDLREALNADIDVVSEKRIAKDSFFGEEILRDRMMLFEA